MGAEKQRGWGVNLQLTLRLVISPTCHFIFGRCRRFFLIMLEMTSLLKSMFVICWHPESYLHMQRLLVLWTNMHAFCEHSSVWYCFAA